MTSLRLTLEVWPGNVCEDLSSVVQRVAGGAALAPSPWEVALSASRPASFERSLPDRAPSNPCTTCPFDEAISKERLDEFTRSLDLIGQPVCRRDRHNVALAARSDRQFPLSAHRIAALEPLVETSASARCHLAQSSQFSGM